MSKIKIVYLSDGEIKSMIALCKACIKMGTQGSEFFERLSPDAQTALKKFEDKAQEF